MGRASASQRDGRRVHLGAGTRLQGGEWEGARRERPQLVGAGREMLVRSSYLFQLCWRFWLQSLKKSDAFQVLPGETYSGICSACCDRSGTAAARGPDPPAAAYVPQMCHFPFREVGEGLEC